MRSIRDSAGTAVCALLLGASACIPPPQSPEQPGPETVLANPHEVLRRAVVSLDEGDYPMARRRLSALAHDCSASSAEVRDRAALLLASVELDVRNPRGAPGEAATIAARLLARSAPGDADAALARLLYMLALDRGAEPVDPASETIRPGYGCPVDPDHHWLDPAPLPQPVVPTSAARLTAMEDTLSVRTDSLRLLHEQLSTAQARAQALEAEIERIRQLLRGPGHDFRDRRDR